MCKTAQKLGRWKGLAQTELEQALSGLAVAWCATCRTGSSWVGAVSRHDLPETLSMIGAWVFRTDAGWWPCSGTRAILSFPGPPGELSHSHCHCLMLSTLVTLLRCLWVLLSRSLRRSVSFPSGLFLLIFGGGSPSGGALAVRSMC